MPDYDKGEKRFWDFQCDCGYDGFFEAAAQARGHEPVFLRCRACGAEALILTCQNCNYLCIDDKPESRPPVWKCPECAIGTELGAEFWSNPIPLISEVDMPAETAERFKGRNASKKQIPGFVVWAILGVCLAFIVVYAILH